MRIVILADDPLLVEDLPRRLRADGHQVSVRSAVGDLPEWLLAEGIHLVVLDADLLPGHRLLDLCRSLHQEGSALLLLLGQTHSITQRIQALDAGADDYLPRPVDRDEVRAHVHALLRRHPLSTLTDGKGSIPVTTALALDLVGQRLVGDGKAIPLTDREFRLLVSLVRHEGAVLSREALLNAVWGDDDAISDREVDVYVRYLRQKLEPDPADPRYLLTVWGRGYQYQGPSRSAPKVLELSNKASAIGTQGSLESLNTFPKLSQSNEAMIGRERMSGGHVGGASARR